MKVLKGPVWPSLRLMMQLGMEIKPREAEK
jgi:hypothetical protein